MKEPVATQPHLDERSRLGGLRSDGQDSVACERDRQMPGRVDVGFSATNSPSGGPENVRRREAAHEGDVSSNGDLYDHEEQHERHPDSYYPLHSMNPFPI